MRQSVLPVRGSVFWFWQPTANMVDLSDYSKNASQLSPSVYSLSLIALYLQDNYDLSAMPPLFFQRLYLLQVLDLSHTSIKSLPKSLPKLVALKKLLLRCCELFMELSPRVGELENLEHLDLDKTQIMDLPREIGKLFSLRHLRVSFYPFCGKNKSRSNIIIQPETLSNLLQLTDLHIDVDPADKRWEDSVEVVVKEVCNPKIRLRSLSLYLPKFQLLEHMSLIYPSLTRFRITVGHIRRRIIFRVPHEVEAEFRNWDKCLKFVNGENIPTEIKGVLKCSNSFFLDNHATATNLSEFGIENMKRLKCCLLAECDQMETIIDGVRQSEGSEDAQSESDPSGVENVLFESLEYLNIYYMENLSSIWRVPSLYKCMSKLKFLALHTCPRLINVFSQTFLENLVNLEEFILEDCPLVTSLVSHSSVKRKPIIPDTFLPNLKILLLLYLPELVSISNGLLIAPKLERIGFYNCPKLKSISKLEMSSKTLNIIKAERQWWENMYWNETEWGNPPDYLVQIFSPINNEKDVMTQLTEDSVLFGAKEEDVMAKLTEDRSLFKATIKNYGRGRSDEEDADDSGQHSLSPSAEYCPDISDIDSHGINNNRHEFYGFESLGTSHSDSPSRSIFTAYRVGHSVRQKQEGSPIMVMFPETGSKEPENTDDDMSVCHNQQIKSQKPLHFENIDLIWYPPPPEDDYDEAESNFFTSDDEDLDSVATFSSSSSVSSMFPAWEKPNVESKEHLKDVIQSHFRALVSQLLLSEGIKVGKEDNAGDWLDIVTAISWKAANFVNISIGGSMYPADHVKVKCIASGTPSQSTVVKGVVCTKNTKHKRFIGEYKNPRLLLLGGALEFPKAPNQLASFSTLLEQEKDHLKMIIAKIEALRPNVLLVEESVSTFAQEYLLAKEIILVLNVKRPLLERIARCTGALICPSIDNLSTARLGHCQQFKLEKVLEEHETANEFNKKPSKTLMFFEEHETANEFNEIPSKTLMFSEGCTSRLGCTVLLRGRSREELKKVKHVVQYCWN